MTKNERKDTRAAIATNIHEVYTKLEAVGGPDGPKQLATKLNNQVDGYLQAVAEFQSELHRAEDDDTIPAVAHPIMPGI